RGAAATYPREPGDLASAGEEALAILRFDSEGKTRRLSRVGDKRPLAVIHRGKIEQVVVNLVRNAVQGTTPERGGWGGVGEEAGAPFVSVVDRGPGMPPHVLAHLGEPFFTTKERGSGLGIGISRRVVEEHGGRLEVVSSVGQGTTVTVRLPPLEVS